MMKKTLQQIFDFFLFSNVFIALCAVAQGLVTFYLMGVKPVPRIAWLLFTATLLVYNFGLLSARPANPLQSPSKRMNWFFAHHRLMVTITIVSFLSLAVLFFQLSAQLETLLIVLCVISLTYSLPLFTLKGIKSGIRNIPGLKQFLISLIWAVSSVLIPVFEARQLGLTHLSFQDAFLLFAERFLFYGALTIPFDIRDLDEDIKTGVKTIPVIWGEKNAYILCGTLLAAYFLSVLLCSNYGFTCNFWALTFTAFAAGWIIFKWKLKKNEYYYFFCVDGILIVQYLVLTAFNKV
jgi:4-hydroxybenzoate polyprenyltransferase